MYVRCVRECVPMHAESLIWHVFTQPFFFTRAFPVWPQYGKTALDYARGNELKSLLQCAICRPLVRGCATLRVGRAYGAVDTTCASPPPSFSSSSSSFQRTRIIHRTRSNEFFTCSCINHLHMYNHTSTLDLTFNHLSSRTLL